MRVGYKYLCPGYRHLNTVLIGDPNVVAFFHRYRDLYFGDFWFYYLVNSIAGRKSNNKSGNNQYKCKFCDVPVFDDHVVSLLGLTQCTIMHFANVKQRQILPRVGKIWASTPQNCATTNRVCFEKRWYLQETVFVVRRFIACLRKFYLIKNKKLDFVCSLEEAIDFNDIIPTIFLNCNEQMNIGKNGKSPFKVHKL